MAETILFDIQSPADGRAEVHRVLWYQSGDGETWGDEFVDSILVDDLVVDGASGSYLWTSALADPSQFHTIRSESAAGVICDSGLTLPPRYSFQLCELYIELKDAELNPISGAEFVFIPRVAPVRGVIFDVRSFAKTTDGNGQIEFFVPQGMTLDFSSDAIGGQNFTVRTDGRAFINLGYTAK